VLPGYSNLFGSRAGASGAQARYHATRILPGRVLNLLLLGQNYHLVHHLWSTIPWYRYQRVYEQVGPALAARGARVGWRVGAPRG